MGENDQCELAVLSSSSLLRKVEDIIVRCHISSHSGTLLRDRMQTQRISHSGMPFFITISSCSLPLLQVRTNLIDNSRHSYSKVPQFSD